MAEDFMEISKEDIENVENALKINSDYKLKNSKFDVKSFEKAKDIVLIQYVANVENELVFNTYEENGRYYISSTFELFIDNIITGNVSRDVFQSVSGYFHDVIDEPENDFYSDDSLNRVQKSLALKELVHMSICQVVNDIDLFFTRPSDLTPEEAAEKNRQEAKALENELQLS